MTSDKLSFLVQLLEILCAAPEDGTNTIAIDVELYKHSSIGTNYTYICVNGYETDEAMKTMCMPTKQWSIAPPNCTGAKHGICALSKCLLFQLPFPIDDAVFKTELKHSQ